MLIKLMQSILVIFRRREENIVGADQHCKTKNKVRFSCTVTFRARIPLKRTELFDNLNLSHRQSKVKGVFQSMVLSDDDC